MSIFIFLDCYQYLGVSNGSVIDSQILESSSIDNNHKGINGRLNGATSWATSETSGFYLVGKGSIMIMYVNVNGNDLALPHVYSKRQFAVLNTGSGNRRVYTDSFPF